MVNYKPKQRQTQKRISSAGDIQARINLQKLARHFYGEGVPAIYSVNYINPFDPDDDYGSLQVFEHHYRDVRTGNRGSAIKFVMKARRCSYTAAVAFCEGWLAATENGATS
ncbi:MAG: hypothetical protein AAFR22_26250 [Chloroflexota bacterium]